MTLEEYNKYFKDKIIIYCYKNVRYGTFSVKYKLIQSVKSRFASNPNRRPSPLDIKDYTLVTTNLFKNGDYYDIEFLSKTDLKKLQEHKQVDKPHFLERYVLL